MAFLNFTQDERIHDIWAKNIFDIQRDTSTSRNFIIKSAFAWINVNNFYYLVPRKVSSSTTVPSSPSPLGLQPKLVASF
ncbi:hypothetical protein EGR_08756 [Echinococcus granulosus]|uniref:Uncharacterized protein n=1 Tax=Echinococcus granulosus TaxID=6210 RepID=W6U7Q4_ECHGR|nr:hypothetical protein EGR_08756 [Echinococcus granulosus]EUB56386.1 hypothetical protein EGR_08756 [Echinococcus granulosus]